MKEKFTLFLKGVLMGICDLIPGISGGTIAFITGIYERLINAVKGFSFDLLLSFFGKGDLRENIKKIDLGFLIVLFLGIFSAIIFGSRTIDFLLENYHSYTISFFIGLILASALLIFEEIENHKPSNYLFGLLGLFIGIILIFISKASVSVSSSYLFLGGFLAISAMFLPGISGSFILLIMGLYEYVIGLLNDAMNNIGKLSVFILGAIFGAFFVSRLISYLFRKDRCKTLYFLLGLVVGALGVPIKRVYESFNQEPSILIISCLFLLGIFLVLFVKNKTKLPN